VPVGKAPYDFTRFPGFKKKKQKKASPMGGFGKDDRSERARGKERERERERGRQKKREVGDRWLH